MSPLVAGPAGGERDRAVAFMSTNDREVAGDVVAFDGTGPSGWAVLDLDRPTVWDANYLWVQRARGADAAMVAQLAEEVQGGAGLAHRYVLFGDQAAGEDLTAGFLELGWHAVPYVVMVHHHLRMLADPSGAREAGAREAAAARRATLLDEAWANAQVAEEILSRDRMIDEIASGRHFVAEAEGEIASYCQLWRRDQIAQVENVATNRRQRNRGLARAVVSLATAQGRDGAEMVFLLADAADWPQHLYRRLGYETVGLLHRFCPTLPQALPRPSQSAG